MNCHTLRVQLLPAVQQQGAFVQGACTSDIDDWKGCKNQLFEKCCGMKLPGYVLRKIPFTTTQ